VLTIPAAVYASFMFIPAGLFAWLMYGRNGVSELESPVSPGERQA
jgi:hypothetical protein